MSNQDDIPFYEKPEWADVVPIPQDDGPNPLVPIAYTKEYSTTMDYFRAICRTQEQSERALELTKIVIELSPSHYTVWHYRQTLLKALNKDLASELDWIQYMIEEHPKSYQIWHHRQVVVEHISATLLPTSTAQSSTATTTTSTSTSTTLSNLSTVADGIPYNDLSELHKEAARKAVKVELDFIAAAVEDDAKNYHAWSYRQWVLKHFGPGPWWGEELEYIDELLAIDIRNNSAWNQRFYAFSQGPLGLTQENVEKEVEYTKNKIERTPSNESPWVYLAGILRTANHPLSEIKSFCEGLIEIPRANFSPFLHSTLLEIYEEEAKATKSSASVNKAKEEAIMLAEKVDPTRAKYWNWRKIQLNSLLVEA
ncbi:CAAX geranylgeranyltransferase alpha subunit [Podila humilis]|nr:CAAX geranylgeranyltransferase alpha subunit [Podila humilis]